LIPVRTAIAMPSSSLELLVQGHERLPHVACRPDRPEGVVVVDLGDAEHGHDRVADELFEGPAVRLEDDPHPVEVPLDRTAEGLGVESLAQRGRSGQVAEEHRDGFAGFASRDQVRAGACRIREQNVGSEALSVPQLGQTNMAGV
jgi:hypothetical protein